MSGITPTMASSYLPLADLIGSGSYMRLSRFLSHFVVLIGRYKVMLVKRFQNCEGQKFKADVDAAEDHSGGRRKRQGHNDYVSM